MPADPKRVKDVFMAVSEAAMADRAPHMDRECGDDADLRQRVEALLKAQEEPGSFLGGPNRGGTAAFQPIPGISVGSTFAERFRIREELGEGGMGVVFVADQTEPVQRRVALKVIRAGADSARVLARFEQERQALALMDHPNIAKVLDAGVSDAGQPYFVMELIKGVPLTKYCDEAKLTPRERLELFIPVCQAVQHAHQKGIIHRDLKPFNILVGLYDGRPVPKVIDFGVAKATGPRISEHSVYTEVGSVIGTFEYMSPEQAELNNLDVDTRSDIYALGVILYELLTGSVPFSRKELQSAGFAEMLRIIKEQEPPKPSTRLSASRELQSVAASRHTEPARLSKLIRGDLDWITMKALEKDRARRYETANGMARDIQRYLAEEPVEACPPSAGYRLRKFAKKNRAALSTAAAIGLLLVAGIGISSWQAWRAKEAERAARVAAEAEAQQRLRAEENERRALASAAAEKAAKEAAQNSAQIADAVNSFLQHDLLGQADTKFQANALLESGRLASEAERDPRISVLLDRAAAQLTPEKAASQFKDHPHVLSAILQSIGNAYRGIGKYSAAIAHLERARDICMSALGPDDPAMLTTLDNLASAYLEASKLPEAIRIYEQVRDVRIRKLGADDSDTLVTLQNLASAYTVAGHWTDAIRLFEQARDARVKILGADHRDTLTIQCNLGWAYFASGKLPEAIQLLERVRAAQMVNLGADHPDTLVTLNNLASAYQASAKLPEAIRILEQIRDARVAKSGPDHAYTLVALKNVAYAYEEAGRLPEAIRLYEQVRDREQAILGRDHRNTLITLNHLGRIYTTAGKLPEAIRALEQVRDAQSAKLGADHPDTLTTRHNLGIAYVKAGRVPEAIQLLEPLRDIKLAKHGIEHQNTLATISVLADAYQKTGWLPDAIRLLEQVRDVRIAKFGLEHPRTLATLSMLASAYDESGRTPEAISLFEQAAQGMERRKFQDQQANKILPYTIGCYERAKEFAKAEAWRRKWLTAVREKFGADSLEHAAELVGLAVNLAQQSKFADAEPMLVAVYETMNRRESQIPEAVRKARVTEALEQLVKLCDDWGKPADAAKWRAELLSRK